MLINCSKYSEGAFLIKNGEYSKIFEDIPLAKILL